MEAELLADLLEIELLQKLQADIDSVLNLFTPKVRKKVRACLAEITNTEKPGSITFVLKRGPIKTVSQLGLGLLEGTIMASHKSKQVVGQVPLTLGDFKKALSSARKKAGTLARFNWTMRQMRDQRSLMEAEEEAGKED